MEAPQTKEIELHTTDIETFVQCRQQWAWQSALRMNLQPMALSAPLFLGQGEHDAWDAYYKHAKKTGVYNIQIGLNALRDWCTDRATKMVESTGVLWEAEKDMVNKMYELGYWMLMHYGMWSKQYDEGIEILGTEYKFRLPVPGMPGFFIAGKFDGLFRYPNGDLYIVEFKTAASFRSMPWVFRGLQSSVYPWAAQQIYGEDVKGIEYRVAWKKRPNDLIPLQALHRFSQKQKQITSYEWAKWQLEQYAKMNGLFEEELFNAHQKLLFGLQGQERFFMRRQIKRTPEQLANAVLVLQNIGAQMADPNVVIFAQPGYRCSWCSMSDPCSLLEIGEDPSMLLSAVYNTRDYWEDES